MENARAFVKPYHFFNFIFLKYNNDILLLYTDGIPESQNGFQEEFGFDRMDDILLKNSTKPNEEISNEIMKEVSVFSTNNEQHDDITLIILKWKF